ncbi:MAG: acyltransferase [Saprospiraceae bacterium]|nr:acyltransferase [Saprospiraceae bacterium]
MFKQLWNRAKNRWYLSSVNRWGDGILLLKRPSIENKGLLTIGDRTQIRSDIHRSRLAVQPGAQLVIGDDCWINGAMIAATQSVRIGNHCRLAPFVHIMDGDFHDLQDRALPGESAPVVLEDHVKVGTRVIILKGVTVHRGAAIAPGAIVTKDVPPDTLVAGVPAKPIKKLEAYSDSLI